MRPLLSIALVCGSALALSAQTRVYGDRIQQPGTTFDSRQAQHTYPFTTESSLPATCLGNEWTYVPAGSGTLGALSVCTAPNTWTTYTVGNTGGANATSINGTSITSFTGLLKLLNGTLTATQVSDLTAFFSGTGTYLRKDGTTDNGPTVPTNTNQLTNGAGFITAAAVPTNDSQLANGAGYITSAALPTNNSQLSNGANYITAAQAPVTSVDGKTGSVVIGRDSNLSQLFTALAQSSNTPKGIKVYGDSETRCSQDSPNPVCNSTGPAHNDALWIERVRARYAFAYGHHGTGVIPLQATVNAGGAFDTLHWTITGTTQQANWLGPAGDNAIGATYSFAPGATATLAPQYAKSFDLYCAEGGDNLGWTATVDGTAVSTTLCNGGGSTRASRYTITAPTGFGLHTLALLANSGSGHSYFYGVEAIASNTGVSVHNFSEGSCRAYCFGNNIALNLAYADLTPEQTVGVVLAFETNEAIASTPIATYKAWLQAVIDHEKSLNPNVTIIIVSGPAVSGYDVSPYVAANLQVAVSNGAVYYDAYTKLFVSYANEQTNGWIGADPLHLTETGSTAWGNYLVQQMFGDADGVVAPPTYNVGTGAAAFTGGALTSAVTITTNAGGESLKITNSLASDFSHMGFQNDNNSGYFKLGVGNSASSIPGQFFIYDSLNARFNLLLDLTGGWTFNSGANATTHTLISSNTTQTDLYLKNTHAAAGNANIHNQYLVSYAGGLSFYDEQAQNNPWHYQYGDGFFVTGKIGVTPSTPAASTDACTAGQMWADANFVYVCTGTNQMKRVALAAF